MKLTVSFNHNLTSLAEKAIYHLRLRSDSPIPYSPGDWLKIPPKNSPCLVEILLKTLNLTGDEIITLRREGELSAQNALLFHLEITQLNPAILNKIQRQYDLKVWENRADMMVYAEGKDILDLLEKFPFLVDLGVDFLSLLSPLAPRYYSIASAPIDPYDVDLLYREVVYDFEGRERRGVTTQGLRQLQAGDVVDAELNVNTAFKLPDDIMTPIIMVGAGTGIAPFIGFCQARFAQAQVSENWLFFGETHRTHCFLFEDTLMKWSEQGLKLFCAFSRDQATKRYVQDDLWDQREAVWDAMQRDAILYVCGSKTGLAKGVETVMKQIIASYTCEDETQVQAIWQGWKTQRRVQMDVY